MIEEIEDRLYHKYNFLTIDVEYDKIKTYKINIRCDLLEQRVDFYHNWQDKLTFTSNIEIIEHHIDNALIRFFKKRED